MRRVGPGIVLAALAALIVLVLAGFWVFGGSSGPSGGATPQSTEAAARTLARTFGSEIGTSRSTEVTNAQPQPDWRPYTGPVPILVYHDLGNAPASEPYPGLYMPYATFESEMAWLHQAGYQAVTLDEMMNAWYHGGRLPAKPIVITFDNGYPPQVTEAPRVMSKYGWPGVLNEITEDHLAPPAIRSVLKLGWEVDSHSLTHPDMTTLDPADLTAQVVQSRQYLQKTFGIPVNSFCYPSSEYNAAVIAAVKAAGYTNAVTEIAAYATRSDPYVLPRFEMTSGLSQLQADLASPH